MYLALQGAKDWFLFDKTISDAVFARKDYSFSFETIRSMTQYGVDVIKNYYGTIALVTLSTYIIGIIIQNKVIRCTVVIEILILPIILLYNRTLPLDDLDNLYYLFYITIWTIPLIAYIPKCKRREVIDLWVITIPASIAGYFAVGYTSDNGALKSPMGVPFVVVTALIMFSYIIADKNDENETKGKLVNISRKKACQVVCEFVLILGVCFELITFYSRSFWYANYSDCNTVFTEGPYKGLRATDGDVARLESLYHFWNENVSDDDTHGIVVTDGGLLPFYLFNNQYMATFEFEWLPYRGSGEGQDWTLSKLYWNKVSGYPEYIITSEANGANGNFKDEFEEQYSLVSTYKDVHMYKKR